MRDYLSKPLGTVSVSALLATRRLSAGALSYLALRHMERGDNADLSGEDIVEIALTVPAFIAWGACVAFTAFTSKKNALPTKKLMTHGLTADAATMLAVQQTFDTKNDYPDKTHMPVEAGSAFALSMIAMQQSYLEGKILLGGRGVRMRFGITKRHAAELVKRLGIIAMVYGGEQIGHLATSGDTHKIVSSLAFKIGVSGAATWLLFTGIGIIITPTGVKLNRLGRSLMADLGTAAATAQGLKVWHSDQNVKGDVIDGASSALAGGVALFESYKAGQKSSEYSRVHMFHPTNDGPGVN